jgi:hypothetical protein
MKIIFSVIAVALLFCCFSSIEAAEENTEILDFCKSISSTAETIMIKRQEQIPMEKMVSILSGSDKQTQKIVEKIIIEAYDHPRFEGKDFITKVVADFKDRWFLDCFKNMSKQKQK